MATLQEALKIFDATEANLAKLESIWSRLQNLIPKDYRFGAPTDYDELCRSYMRVMTAMPAIYDLRLEYNLMEYNDITQSRLDANDVGEISAKLDIEDAISAPGRSIANYRDVFNAKRRDLVRPRMFEIESEINQIVSNVPEFNPEENDLDIGTLGSSISSIQERIDEMDALLGSSQRPSRWSDIRRHLSFGSPVDLYDIINYDWPAIQASLTSSLYGPDDPIPVGTNNLSDIVSSSPTGKVAIQLRWDVLSDETFERLMFFLLSDTEGYENPMWLQHTNAPDRGRDLSVERVERDLLGGTRRYRTIIQCKHWRKRSISPADVGVARDQMELWHPPRVDNLIIATTGRFTVDAVDLVERHNQSNHALRIDMWPDSHIERLLAARPRLIAQFGLRDEK